VAIPLTAIPQVPVEPLAGKVVISTINYVPQRDGRFPELDNGTATVAGLLQAHLPTSKVVRAFSMLGAADMSGDGRPEGDPERRALALAGDELSAKRLVARLYDEFGFDAVDIGGLDESWRVDVGQPAFVTRQNVAGLTANVAKAERGLDPASRPCRMPEQTASTGQVSILSCSLVSVSLAGLSLQLL
jgi:predicted dinucleotide-binding enzyme